MWKSILVIAAVATLAGTAGNAAGAKRSLSDYLESCRSNQQTCTMVAYNLIEAGKNSRYLCVPKTVSVGDAAAKQVAWLQRKAEDNPRFANEDLLDAQWTAADTLWSCGKK